MYTHFQIQSQGIAKSHLTELSASAQRIILYNPVSSSESPEPFIVTCCVRDFSFSAFHTFKDKRQLLLNGVGIRRHLVAASSIKKKNLPPELAIFSKVSPFSFFGNTKHIFL